MMLYLTVINVFSSQRSECKEEYITIDASEARFAFHKFVFLSFSDDLSDGGHNIITHNARECVLHYTGIKTKYNEPNITGN